MGWAHCGLCVGWRSCLPVCVPDYPFMSWALCSPACVLAHVGLVRGADSGACATMSSCEAWHLPEGRGRIQPGKAHEHLLHTGVGGRAGCGPSHPGSDHMSLHHKSFGTLTLA